MRYIKISVYVLLAVLLVSIMPYAAEAGQVRIRPHQFKPRNPADPHNWQLPSCLKGDGGGASYYAPVNLPVGKKLTRMVVFHSFQSGSLFYVYLVRYPFGVADRFEDQVTQVECTGGVGVAPVASDTTYFDYPKVKSGFRYFVEAQLANGSRLHGVKIRYE